jgi:hypothetical protein
MIKKIVLLLILITATFVPKNSFAWSREGHHIVVEIAYQLLSTSAKEKLKAYLGDTSIYDAATWMDEQRGGNNQFKLPNHRPDQFSLSLPPLPPGREVQKCPPSRLWHLSVSK